MVTTIQEVLRPLLITCFIVGLSGYPIKQPKIRWILYLSNLYSLTVWFAYVYFFYYAVNIFTLKGLFGTTTSIIVTVINILATITSTIVNFYNHKKFEICIKKLAVVDDTLEKLGTAKMYQETHMWSKRIIIGWILYSIAINCFDIFEWLNTTNIFWALILPYITNHYAHINAFMDLLFIFFLWHLHLELCRISRELNLMFGTQLTLEMTSYLLYLTVLCYYLCLVMTHKFGDLFLSIHQFYQFINLGNWIFICLIRLSIINYAFEAIRAKANEVDKIIHQLTSCFRYADLSMEIYQFTLQTMQQPLKFTGLGLFNFGNTFIRKFCLTIVMYVLIMTQMKIDVAINVCDNSLKKNVIFKPAFCPV